MEKYSTKDLSKIILVLAGATILVPTLAMMPGLGYALRPLLKKGSFYPSHIEGTIKRLKRQKLISVKERKDGKTEILLTEDGRRKALTYKLEEMKLKSKKWDGWWRIVVFDIPEKKKYARNFLRNKMKEIGFYLLQESVLVTPWECRNEVDFIKHYYDIGDCISIIKAKTFDGEELVKNYFNL